MKLVSFYSDIDNSTFYSDRAKNLIEQCKNLRIDATIVERNFGNSWIDNVRAKPIFLLEMLEKLNQPFIWLDCDCNVLKPLDFSVESDWGVYMRENGTPHDFVHYISNTQNTKNFLRLWIQTIEKQKRGSHTAFIRIFNQIDSQVLPEGYFEIGLAETQSKNDYFNKSK